MEEQSRVLELFDRLVDRPPDERDEVLRRECANQSTMREQLLALLAAHDGMGEFLEEPAAALVGEEPPDDQLPPVGARLAEFGLTRLLGRGGGGAVYEATVAERVPGLEVGGRVALKLVHPHLMQTPGFFRRFLREAQLGQSIRHENVVRTLDCSQVEVEGIQRAFLVMEYVEGQNLRDLLDELETVPEELCRHIARGICRGLAAIHSADVVHRDLKPENVLITEDHTVKVMDLGIARLADERMRLSQTGAFVGTIEYAAPEQFGVGEVDHRCDLHALGLVLYELACGQHPYRGDDFRAVMRRVCQEEPRRLGQINPQLSPFFEEVVHNLLAKSSGERFQSSAELLAVLEEGDDSEWWNDRARELQLATKQPLRRIRIPRETAVYGREKELARLRSLFESAKSGEGQIVLVEGEAGIGKSRLVDELISRLRDGGEDLNFLFGSYPPGGAATAAGALSTAFREHFGASGSAEFLTQTPLLVPAFDAVLRGEPAPTDAVELTNESVATCFVHATRNLASERPTVVLIDDLHFAPEDALSLFTAVSMAVPGHRVLLLGTMRPGVPEGWVASLTRLDHSTRLELPRLGPKDLAALLQDSFKSQQLAEHLAFQIGTKSDGNPFFAFEIIRGLREGQFIAQRPDGSWVTTKVIDEIQIPSSVLDLVNARVASLSQQDRDVLDVAACWGYEFDPALISDATGIARIPLYKKLAQVERAHRLVRSSGRNFVFDHHQVQEALYSSLPEVLREEYHAALADALATRKDAPGQDPETLDGELCVSLCEHYLKGGQGEAAIRYLAAAQTYLAKGHLHAHVSALTERALAIPGLLTGAGRGNALIRLAAALHVMGRRTREEECAQEAERLAEELCNSELRGRAVRALGLLCLRTARLEEARERFEGYLALAREIGDRVAEATATGDLGNVFLDQGRYEEARAHYERDRDLSRKIGDRKGEATATGNLALALDRQGRYGEARVLLEQRIAMARRIGDRGGEAIAIANLGGVFLAQGRYAEARDCYEQRIGFSQESGDRRTEALALGNLGLALSSLGDKGRARASLEASVAICSEVAALRSKAYGLHRLALLADEDADRDGTLRYLDAALALRREIGYGPGIVESLLVLGELHRRAGDSVSARSALEEAVSLARRGSWTLHLLLGLAHEACLPGGDVQAAVAAFDDAPESGDRHFRVLYLPVLYRATGDVAHLREARGVLDALLTLNPEKYHAAMKTNVRVHREILEAWEAEFGPADGVPT